MQPGLVQIPVFVKQKKITFYLDDQTTYEQVLTLYNPYEFAVRFRVLCKAPRKYTVVDPEGSIRPRSCIDIAVRHNAVSPANCNVIDKFRIQMLNFSTEQLIGKKDFAATLLPGKPSGSVSEPEVLQHIPERRMEYAGVPIQHHFGLTRDIRPRRLQTLNYGIVLAAIVCICALLLPTEGDKDTKFPEYLHLTSELKLLFAYVLGVVTVLVLRPS